MPEQVKMTPEQMGKTIEQLRAELADANQHIAALKNIRREQSNRTRGMPSPKKNSGYRVVRFRETRQYKTPKGETINNIFWILIETPWPATLHYETVKKLWLEEADSILATFGYINFFPEGKYVPQKNRMFPLVHPAIDSAAFCDSITYQAGSYYTISFYAGSAPKIFPETD